jgi:hypothetical protein
MKKCFCASCNIEKPVPNPFTLNGCSTEFCKQCRAPTPSYWAEEPKPSVLSRGLSVGIRYSSVDIKKSKKSRRSEKGRSNNEKHTTERVKEEEKTVYTRPLEELIKEAWRENATGRAWIADHWREIAQERKDRIERQKKEAEEQKRREAELKKQEEEEERNKRREAKKERRKLKKQKEQVVKRAKQKEENAKYDCQVFGY